MKTYLCDQCQKVGAISRVSFSPLVQGPGSKEDRPPDGWRRLTLTEYGTAVRLSGDFCSPKCVTDYINQRRAIEERV